MRSLQELFKAAEERQQEMSYVFSASVLEIYTEQIFDLLVPGPQPPPPYDCPANRACLPDVLARRALYWL